MIDWNEDNFLEKLTPQLRKKSGGAMGPCPDAETLCAVIEGEARGPERDAVIEHLSQCAACAELRSRLLNFESVSPPEPEAVWKQTRTRLDNWLEGFLRSEAAHSGSPKGSKPSRRVPGWESISNLFTSGKVIWASGVAVALVLTLGAVVFLGILGGGGYYLYENLRKPFQPPVGQLLVAANVSGAKISVDGQSGPNWVTPYTISDLSVGSHQVVVSKEGYDNDQQAVAIEGGKTSSFNASLPARVPEPPKTPPEGPAPGKVKPAKNEVEAPAAIPVPRGVGGRPSAVPKTGQLQVTANVSGAKISVDGRSEPDWVTPYSSTINLAAGTRQVVVSKEGYDDYQQSVIIEGGKTNTLNASLSVPSGGVATLPGLDVLTVTRPGAAPAATVLQGYVTAVEGNKVMLDVGSSSPGIHQGSRLALYKASDPNTRVGVIEIIQVIDAGTSRAKIVMLNTGVRPEWSDVVRPAGPAMGMAMASLLRGCPAAPAAISPPAAQQPPPRNGALPAAIGHPPTLSTTTAAVACPTPAAQMAVTAPPAYATSPASSPGQTAVPLAKVERVRVECFSDPTAADILIDGEFYGNTPSILKIPVGKHALEIQLSGYKTYSIPLILEPGTGIRTIRASLEQAAKSLPAPPPLQ